MRKSPVIARAGIVTWTVLALAVALTLWTDFGAQRARLIDFLFLRDAIAQGEIWRIWTPAFLHFSMWGSPIFHILFNGMWWLVFAGLIESRLGRVHLLLFFLFTAALSNLAAWLAYGPLFGGLSGVVYALVGYVWLLGFRSPLYRHAISHGLMIAFVIFMLAGWVGLLDGMADYAHIAGLATGLLWGAAVLGWQHLNDKNQL